MPARSEQALVKRRTTIRQWALDHPEEVAGYKENWRRKTGSSAGRGSGSKRSWTQKEDRQVIEHSIPDRDLAEKIGRSVTAIQVRRSRLRDTPGPCGPCSGPGVLSCEHTSG